MTLPEATLADTLYNGPMHPRNRSPPDNPSSYLQLSDLRTGSKRKRGNSSVDLSTPSSPRSEWDFGLQVISGLKQCFGEGGEKAAQALCVDCVVDCNDADCQASPEEQCTDHCIGIPCDNTDECTKVCTEEACPEKPCDGGKECMGPLDESLQLLCCTDYHDYFASACTNVPSGHVDWSCPLDDILGVNKVQSGFPSYAQFPGSSASINITSSNQEMPYIESAPSGLSAVLTENNASDSAFATPDETKSTAPTTHSVTQQTTSNEFACRWLDCNASFSSLNELVGHVNLTHLRAPSAPPAKKLCLESATHDLFPLSCHWDDCRTYPNASALPGPSTGLQPEMAFDFLSNHFMHDHLGLSVPPPPQVAPIFQDAVLATAQVDDKAKILLTENTNQNDVAAAAPANISPSQASNATVQNAQASKPTEPSYVTPEPSPPPSTIPTDSIHTHDCSTSTHICQWESCNASFDTCAELTAHLTAVHVGSGKGRYDCHWSGCARSGAQGFTSKQKIMRHLQAHTGHRPFVCKECGQHFSEAATLAQHMRRHTQERPYVCDFPGCGKAFAITGALTIHKRTHNGERPFRCPHCERAFAESSNLSKHLRTHTGDRPYRCTEPGCGKAFARPDQLQRHGNVHAKKKGMTTNARSVTESVVVK